MPLVLEALCGTAQVAGLAIGGAKYWDGRYQTYTKPFEWLGFDFADLRPILDELTSGDKETWILDVGCGNSLLTEAMYDNGFHNIVNVDSSTTVIDQMLQRNTGVRPHMKWVVGDALKMDFLERKFDLVIDKSTLDCFSSGDSSIAQSYVKEVKRAMKDDGAYLCISFGAPDTRRCFFEHPDVDFDVRIVEVERKYPHEGLHYCYICRKKSVESSLR
eukprot:gnl/TRDRNA2_/TRDRNA2_155611_c0_seq2.p1 gnl/TRDRNA2_/TRDRNA2_155611_c0~~gnl/TRDRNA2_/TRDRNA2_155611_c0_seq2.p1  ORF type:complete len:217 (+),score=27.79 gnl/TRDRNA2_/TRDRNA2_155611_c0_seq2:315-965(+)